MTIADESRHFFVAQKAQCSLSVVIPCFDESESLNELWQRVTAACLNIVGDNFEIVLVNDGSRDSTWEKMSIIAKRDSHVVAVNLSRNYGHQLALSAGLAVCRGERALVLDADLQDPPELLGKMMTLMDAGADVVYGQRIIRNGETWFKRAMASFFYRLFESLSEIKMPINVGDFRLISRRAIDVLNGMPEKDRFIRGMVSWIGLKQVPILYERDARFAGISKYPFRKMIRFAIDAITGFSIVPMRIVSYTGIAIGVAAIIMILYTLFLWLAGETIQGWTSLMVVVLVIGSAQLLSLGIFGEYLGRLYMESKRRPLFIIDEIVRS